jgi:hypothetical protein
MNPGELELAVRIMIVCVSAEYVVMTGVASVAVLSLGFVDPDPPVPSTPFWLTFPIVDTSADISLELSLLASVSLNPLALNLACTLTPPVCLFVVTDVMESFSENSVAPLALPDPFPDELDIVLLDLLKLSL